MTSLEVTMAGQVEVSESFQQFEGHIHCVLEHSLLLLHFYFNCTGDAASVFLCGFATSFSWVASSRKGQ